MSLTGRALPVAAAVALLIGSGLARRRATDDAGTAAAVRAAAQRLPGLLPESAGEWSGPLAEVNLRGLDRAGVAGLAARRYRNARTGAAVTAVVLCGRPGPIAVHTPESCYPELGYAPVNKYLPQRPRRAGAANSAPPVEKLDEERLPPLLRWLDRALSR